MLCLTQQGKRAEIAANHTKNVCAVRYFVKTLVPDRKEV